MLFTTAKCTHQSPKFASHFQYLTTKTLSNHLSSTTSNTVNPSKQMTLLKPLPVPLVGFNPVSSVHSDIKNDFTCDVDD